MLVEKYQIQSFKGWRVLVLIAKGAIKMYKVENAHEYIVRECFEGNDPFIFASTPDEAEYNIRQLIAEIKGDTLEVMSKLFNDKKQTPLYQKMTARLISFVAPAKEKSIYKKMKSYKSATFQLSFENGISGYLTTEPNAAIIVGMLYTIQLSCFKSKIEIDNIRQYKNSYSLTSKIAA